MVLDRFSLHGKVAVVTGAGRGIGKGIALAFADAGADVVCVSRTTSEIEAVAAEIKDRGRRSLAVTCDVTDGDHVESMVKAAVHEFARIDILVNNAGGASYRPSMQLSQRAFEAIFRINLLSVFLCCKATAKVMIEQKSGAIVNISTRDSIIPCPGMLAYGAAKAGVNSLTRTLAWELAPYVRVNCILPGGVLTEASAPLLEPVKDKLIAGTPRGRMGIPQDIALAALYLASPASDWVTGRIFEIDGGIEFVHLDVQDMMSPRQT